MPKFVADSSVSPTGLKWAVDPVADVVTTAGDLLYATAADTVTRLGIGTAGQVLKVNSGATAPEWGAAGGAGFVGAYAFKTANSGVQSIANTTFTVITFNDELFDTDGFHSTSVDNSRMTIPSGKAGKYLVTGRGTFAANNAGNRGVRLLKNGSLFAEIQTWNAGGTYGATVEVTAIYDFAVNDYIELASFQASGGSLNTQNGNDYYDALMIQYLGA